MKIFLYALLLFETTAFAQTLPSNRKVDWSVAGYRDSFPNPANVFNMVTAFGAIGDSATDNAIIIQTAIDSLHGQRGVLYFPPGKYLVSAQLNLRDSVILRGASSDSTMILFNMNGNIGNGFYIGGSETTVFTSVTGGAVFGSNYIVVNDTAGYTAGCYAELIEDNGSWDTQPAVWANNSVGQILKITTISADTLFFDSPLRISYDSILLPRVQRINPITEVGIECMRIFRNDTATSTNYNVWFNFAANCWVRGVESSASVGSHIEIDASSNITVTGCYIHHSYNYDGVSTHGYGITLFKHAGQCLITNNIMQHLRHSFSLQTGANGNVISYNYSLDPNRSEFPSNYGADISLHGHFPYANLFEGNIVQNIGIDQTHGPSGPLNTFLRNRAELYGLIMTTGSVESDSQNFVGNEIPNTGPFMGNYMLYGSGNFEYANNVRGVITPAGATTLNDTSYYLTSPPPFWSGPFPTIGMPNLLSSGSIPARERYLSGVYLAACVDSLILSTDKLDERIFSCYPNPATDLIHIRTDNNLNGRVFLKDLNCKIILDEKFLNGTCDLKIPEFISNGIYLMQIITDRSGKTMKMVVTR
jgi:hypothetical protein